MWDWGAIVNAGVQAGGSYLQYQDKKDRAKDLDRRYQAYLKAREAQSQSSGSGSGGGNRTAAAQMLQQYLTQAQEKYQPYVQAGLDVLPQTSALYGSALPGAANFATSALSAENIADALRYDAPKQPALPEYLRGG